MSALLVGFKQAVMQTPKNFFFTDFKTFFQGAIFSHTQRKAYFFMSKIINDPCREDGSKQNVGRGTADG